MKPVPSVTKTTSRTTRSVTARNTTTSNKRKANSPRKVKKSAPRGSRQVVPDVQQPTTTGPRVFWPNGSSEESETEKAMAAMHVPQTHEAYL